MRHPLILRCLYFQDVIVKSVSPYLLYLVFRDGRGGRQEKKTNKEEGKEEERKKENQENREEEKNKE